MHAYLKSLEVSNFKGFSAYFARMSPLGVYTYAFGFHSDNLTPFWTVSQRVDRKTLWNGQTELQMPVYRYLQVTRRRT